MGLVQVRQKYTLKAAEFVRKQQDWERFLIRTKDNQYFPELDGPNLKKKMFLTFMTLLLCQWLWILSDL